MDACQGFVIQKAELGHNRRIEDYWFFSCVKSLQRELIRWQLRTWSEILWTESVFWTPNTPFSLWLVYLWVFLSTYGYFSPSNFWTEIELKRLNITSSGMLMNSGSKMLSMIVAGYLLIRIVLNGILIPKLKRKMESGQMPSRYLKLFKKNSSHIDINYP